MSITVKEISTKQELKQFIKFPWKIYGNDPNWVPPLLDDRAAKLDINRNPYWQNAERSLWIAFQGKKPVGTIAAMVDHHRNECLHQSIGAFGFFESINDKDVANQLLETTAQWLKSKGMSVMRGPYNPTETDEIGILIEGFETRPAILESHTPPYYPALIESAGFDPYNHTVARLILRPTNARSVEEALPEQLVRISKITLKRPDLKIRQVDMAHWEDEVGIACDIYNNSLTGLPDFVPVPRSEFLTFANSFKSILPPDEALIAEINGKPVGYMLALPDVNEALQHLNGRLWPFGIIKLWWYMRHIRRVSFKILMILPEYQNRGIESVLITEWARVAWKKGYQEVDMSVTGDENIKSNRFQDHLGMKVYRRYQIYEKKL
jgi:GNAT superfamily N-acetyltransferase